MELDHHFDCPEPDHAPQMGNQTHRPVPREERAICPTDRDAVEPRIGERDRLDEYGPGPSAFRRGTEKRGFERQCPVAVAACSFRKQDQSVANGEPFGYRVALGCGIAYSPIDKDRALQSRKRPEKRPIRHLAFGDKRAGNQRTKDRDISVRDVIRREKHGALGGRPTDAPDPKPENSATPAVVEGW